MREVKAFIYNDQQIKPWDKDKNSKDLYGFMFWKEQRCVVVIPVSNLNDTKVGRVIMNELNLGTSYPTALGTITPTNITVSAFMFGGITAEEQEELTRDIFDSLVSDMNNMK